MIDEYKKILKEKIAEKEEIEERFSKIKDSKTAISDNRPDTEILDDRIAIVKVEYEIKIINNEIQLLNKTINKLNFLKKVKQLENNSRNS